VNPDQSVRWYSTETDPEHIAGRGFEVALAHDGLHLVDPEAQTPPPLVLRSAWGYTTRSERPHWPYDFHPTVFVGVQLWDDRRLPTPAAISSLASTPIPRSGRGAYVSIDEAPLHSGVMEFVFSSDPWREPDEILMAQVLLDQTPASADPFVVAAHRLVEPLFRDLHAALAEANERNVEILADLRSAVAELQTDMRQLDEQPAKMRRAVQLGLAAIGTIVLNIVATRIDPLLDHIDWPRLLETIWDVARRLGLG
jgi:hypothetical protein